MCKINEFIKAIMSRSRFLGLAVVESESHFTKSNRAKSKLNQTAEPSSTQYMAEKGESYQTLFSLNHLSGGPKSWLPPSHRGDGGHEEEFPMGQPFLRQKGKRSPPVTHFYGSG